MTTLAKPAGAAREAVEAMDEVRAALDAWLKGDKDSDKTLIVIAEVWGRYEGRAAVREAQQLADELEAGK